ncbi:MAG: RNA chaperone Hfq [Candidatus Wallbacteria bacterium HGW-Wallbacteria-1]|jgi:host factor-I protein|uniref:RNA chaperone Hfq n=1 Tax=Candidatus Wallbacteria bacterium HGW-Wallbacteria-1 TaxID=2013854 RepID=A0A2N1PU74_9BACT|nr:MAG: RNA chaperone Hfq [Candidatus Wallbacteria bacterium HGW-Wallbacteria-1]
MANTFDLQNSFFYLAKGARVKLTIYTKKGIPITGRLISYDDFSVLLSVKGKQELIYKSFISTIIPHRNLDLFTDLCSRNRGHRSNAD